MDPHWIPQLFLIAVFLANFAFDAVLGTSGLHKTAFFRFWHAWVFGRLWSGPAYLLPLLSQPRLPTHSGAWWAGVIGDPDLVRTDLTFGGIAGLDVFGWMLFAAAWALWIGAFIPRHPWSMEPPADICRSGVYGLVRHPVNLGWLLFIAGWYSLWGGLYSLMLSPIFLVFFVLEALWEEKYLLSPGNSNAEYEAYRRAVPMLWPDFPPRNPPRQSVTDP